MKGELAVRRRFIIAVDPTNLKGVIYIIQTVNQSARHTSAP